MRTRSVLVVLFDGVQSLDVTGPLEVLAGANNRQSARESHPAYEILTACHGGGPVRTSSGLLMTPDADLSVPALAHRASLSPRQFARAFSAEVGMTPGRYVGKARLEAARRHLEDTGQDVGDVARACGYGTSEAMRRAFVRALGFGPTEYRRRFRPNQPPASEDTDADRHPAV